MAGTVVIDRGYKAMMARLAALEELEVHVGIQNDGAEHKGKLIATYAAANEFGAPRAGVPERSFMRSSFDDNVDLLNQTVDRIRDLVVDGKLDANTGAEILGQLHQDQVVAKINSNVGPPLKPATIKRKGSSKTLIDDAFMKGAVRFVVKKRKGRLRRFIDSILGKTNNVVRRL